MRRGGTPASEAMVGSLILAGATAGTALVFHEAARQAERAHPPLGRFLEVDGIRLHLLEEGRGPALVVLHGNGSMVQDFRSSPAHAELVRRYRVYLFDRPGYGHSSRPRGRPMGPRAQAALFAQAFERLGLRRPIVYGHSWGALPALALGLDHPQRVGALVLGSGYYFPRPRGDSALMAIPGLPGVGDVLRHTVSPVIARLIWPRLINRIFGPNPEPEAFARGFPKAMALRPSQLRAAAVEAGLLLPAARELSARLGSLTVPTVIVAGEADLVVDTARQSVRLHDRLAGSRLRLAPATGHMIHHSAPARVVSAIDEAGRMAGVA